MDTQQHPAVHRAPRLEWGIDLTLRGLRNTKTTDANRTTTYPTISSHSLRQKLTLPDIHRRVVEHNPRQCRYSLKTLLLAQSNCLQKMSLLTKRFEVIVHSPAAPTSEPPQFYGELIPFFWSSCTTPGPRSSGHPLSPTHRSIHRCLHKHK